MAAIGAEIKKGSAELAVLALLAGEPLHGYEIAKRIERRTQGVLRFDVASLYPLLYRMERRGWVRGSWEAGPRGRRRRLYRLTPAGKKKLVPLREQWRAFFRALRLVAGIHHA